MAGRRPRSAAHGWIAAVACLSVSLSLPLTPGPSHAAAASRPRTTLAALAFSSARVGFAVGQVCGALGRCAGLVLRTRDGGAHWRVRTLPTHALTGIDPLGATRIWVWGPSGLWRTTDGGARWSRSAWPSWQSGDGPQFEIVSFASSADGWLAEGGVGCAMQGCGTYLFTSSDGGATWRPVATDVPRGPGGPHVPHNLPWADYGSAVDLGDARGLLFASDPVGTALRTGNGGRMWSQRAMFLNGYAAAFTAGGDGWAVGETCTSGCRRIDRRRYAVDATTDGGVVWRRTRDWVPASPGGGDGLPTELAPELAGAGVWAAIAYRDPPTRCAQGCGAGARAIVPLGDPTRPTPLPAGWVGVAVAALSPCVTWAVVNTPNGDRLARTTDGGRSWRLVWPV